MLKRSVIITLICLTGLGWPCSGISLSATSNVTQSDLDIVAAAANQALITQTKYQTLEQYRTDEINRLYAENWGLKIILGVALCVSLGNR